ncbi:MAG: DUF4339 domain-containing protein [Tepidisphaeraceae bacterium]
MDAWHYSTNGQPQGPVSQQQLQQMLASGQLAPSDLVWTNGMSNWVPASSVLGTGTNAESAASVFQYASPGLVQGSVAPQLRPLPDDPGPFEKVSNQFSVRGKSWFGPVIASPKALYLVKSRRGNNGAGMAIGGIAGALIQTAIEGGDSDDVRTCAVRQLNPALCDVFDRKRKLGDQDVIVLPLDAVQDSKYSGWGGKLKLNVGGDLFAIVIGGLFSRGKRKRMLGMGWTMDGPRTATAAPLHGSGFARSATTPPPKGTHPALRALYALLGAGLIIAVILLRALLR